MFYNDNNLTFVLCIHPFGDAHALSKVSEKNKKCYLTIIPFALVGYEMVNSQRGA